MRRENSRHIYVHLICLYGSWVLLESEWDVVMILKDVHSSNSDLSHSIHGQSYVAQTHMYVRRYSNSFVY